MKVTIPMGEPRRVLGVHGDTFPTVGIDRSAAREARVGEPGVEFDPPVIGVTAGR